MDAYSNRENSLILRFNSLIRGWKFPILLRREFSWKPLNSRADWTPKSQRRAAGRATRLVRSGPLGTPRAKWAAGEARPCSCGLSWPARAFWRHSNVQATVVSFSGPVCRRARPLVSPRLPARQQTNADRLRRARSHLRARSRKRARECGFPGSDPCEEVLLLVIEAFIDVAA